MKDNIRMYGVLSKNIDYVWEEVKPILSKAMVYTYGKFKVEDILPALKSCELQLWLMVSGEGIQACVVTQIIKYPRRNVLMMVFAAGKNCDEWVHFIEDFKEFGKEKDCDSIEIYGRRGWKKAMEHLGIQELHTVFKFDITKE